MMNSSEKSKPKIETSIDFNNNICQNRLLLNSANNGNNNKEISSVYDNTEDKRLIQQKVNTFRNNIKDETSETSKQLINFNQPNDRNNFTDPNKKSQNITSTIPNSLRTLQSIDDPNVSALTTPPKQANNQRIKRPMNAFMVWSRERRRIIAETSPNLHNAEISRMLGNDWRKMTDEEKHPYYDEAKLLQEQHHITYPDYKYKPRRRKNNGQSACAQTDAGRNGKMLGHIGSNQYGFLPYNPKILGQNFGNHVYPLPSSTFPLKQFNNFNSVLNMDNQNKQNSIPLMNNNRNFIPNLNISNIQTLNNTTNNSSINHSNNNSTNNMSFTPSHDLVDLDNSNYNIMRQPLMQVERNPNSLESRNIVDVNRQNINNSPSHNDTSNNSVNDTFDNEINHLMGNSNTQHYFPGANSNQSWILNNIDKMPYTTDEMNYGNQNNNIAKAPLYHNSLHFPLPFGQQYQNDRWNLINDNVDPFVNFNNPYRNENIHQLGHFLTPNSQTNTSNYSTNFGNYTPTSQNSNTSRNK